jgi:hypothetical protein
MRLCSEAGEQEEEVSGWQEDVQLLIGRGQDGLEADGNLYWRHESDATRRRPLWIAGGYREILKAGLESGSGIANTPYRGTDWYKVKSDGQLVGFRKAAILPSRTKEDLSKL